MGRSLPVLNFVEFPPTPPPPLPPRQAYVCLPSGNALQSWEHPPLSALHAINAHPIPSSLPSGQSFLPSQNLLSSIHTDELWHCLSRGLQVGAITAIESKNKVSYNFVRQNSTTICQKSRFKFILIGQHSFYLSPRNGDLRLMFACVSEYLREIARKCQVRSCSLCHHATLLQQPPFARWGVE